MQDTSNLFSGGHLPRAVQGQLSPTTSKTRTARCGSSPNSLLARRGDIHPRDDVIDSVTTHRRYPQDLISDQTYPVQENMMKGNSVVVETISSFGPPRCRFRCATTRCGTSMLSVRTTISTVRRPPVRPFLRFPILASTSPPIAPTATTLRVDEPRVHLLRRRALRCADLPAGEFKPGQASVTFGDVLYHSGADVVRPSAGSTTFTCDT